MFDKVLCIRFIRIIKSSEFKGKWHGEREQRAMVKVSMWLYAVGFFRALQWFPCVYIVLTWI